MCVLVAVYLPAVTNMSLYRCAPAPGRGHSDNATHHSSLKAVTSGGLP